MPTLITTLLCEEPLEVEDMDIFGVDVWLRWGEEGVLCLRCVFAVVVCCLWRVKYRWRESVRILSRATKECRWRAGTEGIEGIGVYGYEYGFGYGYRWGYEGWGIGERMEGRKEGERKRGAKRKKREKRGKKGQIGFGVKRRSILLFCSVLLLVFLCLLSCDTLSRCLFPSPLVCCSFPMFSFFFSFLSSLPSSFLPSFVLLFLRSLLLSLLGTE